MPRLKWKSPHTSTQSRSSFWSPPASLSHGYNLPPPVPIPWLMHHKAPTKFTWNLTCLLYYILFQKLFTLFTRQFYNLLTGLPASTPKSNSSYTPVPDNFLILKQQQKHCSDCFLAMPFTIVESVIFTAHQRRHKVLRPVLGSSTTQLPSTSFSSSPTLRTLSYNPIQLSKSPSFYSFPCLLWLPSVWGSLLQPRISPFL